MPIDVGSRAGLALPPGGPALPGTNGAGSGLAPPSPRANNRSVKKRDIGAPSAARNGAGKHCVCVRLALRICRLRRVIPQGGSSLIPKYNLSPCHLIFSSGIVCSADARQGGAGSDVPAAHGTSCVISHQRRASLAHFQQSSGAAPPSHNACTTTIRNQ